MYEKENLVELYKKLEKVLHRRLVKKDWIESKITPSDMPLRCNFGGWNKFLEYMGLEVKKPFISKLARSNSIKVRKNRSVEEDPRFIGRRKYKGYVEIYKPNHPNSNSHGYIREHRFLVSEHIVRPLTTDEDVHHINGIKDDNRLENLQLILKSEHTKLHHKGKKIINGSMSYKHTHFNKELLEVEND